MPFPRKQRLVVKENLFFFFRPFLEGEDVLVSRGQEEGVFVEGDDEVRLGGYIIFMAPAVS
jgi:hypothetical protein